MVSWHFTQLRNTFTGNGATHGKDSPLTLINNEDDSLDMPTVKSKLGSSSMEAFLSDDNGMRHVDKDSHDRHLSSFSSHPWPGSLLSSSVEWSSFVCMCVYARVHVWVYVNLNYNTPSVKHKHKRNPTKWWCSISPACFPQWGFSDILFVFVINTYIYINWS